MEKTNIEKLTDLQNKVGYVKGQVNVVALLGLFGEAGEVLDEFDIADKSDDPEIVPAIRKAIDIAKNIDNMKKRIRDKSFEPKVSFVPTENLDKELIDVLYYLNALCINRGTTLEELAGKSVEKVLKRSAQDISHGTINSLFKNFMP